MKRILSIFLVLALCMPLCIHGLTFTDVPENSWAVGDINEANAAGIMQGRGGTIFGYGDKILRSEFAAMLTRLMSWQTESGETSKFTDVKPNQWYT
ncbi:MAG: S-layer homology domain-containing protein, partial [Clostridia bacterium]|nr:S-layer homology domain-containing protein [Clostridia bacterium]